MSASNLTLDVLPTELAVCRLDCATPAPAWTTRGSFTSVTRTDHELSVVCDAASVPASVRCERDFAALAVRGPLDFALTGVLAALASPLAEAEVPVFAISTFDTDYLLVRRPDLDRARDVLQARGHRVATSERRTNVPGERRRGD